MRWKALFYDNPTSNNNNSDTFGFRSRKCPPVIADMKHFENDVFSMVNSIEFRKISDPFQQQLQEDIKTIRSSTKAFIPADKTTNIYKLEKTSYDKLLHDNITSAYKKASSEAYNKINQEAKVLASTLKIGDRTECMAKRQAFITLKDHKDNFENKPSCRLINPAKSDIGVVSKSIVDRINTSIRSQTV